MKNEKQICTSCHLSLPLTKYSQNPENPVYLKFASFKSVEFAFSYMYFNRLGIAQNMIHSLKYGGNYDVGILMGSWIGNQIESLEYDYLIPVPLHSKKLRKRGFNQSEAISEGISLITGIPVLTNILERTVDTSTQTKKSKISRFENVDDIFKLSQKEDLTEKRLILVDDIITTGFTIGAICELMEKAGVKNIGIVSVASGD